MSPIMPDYALRPQSRNLAVIRRQSESAHSDQDARSSARDASRRFTATLIDEQTDLVPDEPVIFFQLASQPPMPSPVPSLGTRLAHTVGWTLLSLASLTLAAWASVGAMHAMAAMAG